MRKKVCWTPKEISDLREIYPKQGAAGVHKLHPHRTIESIRTQAKKLGVCLSTYSGIRGAYIAWSPQDIDTLAQVYPTSTPEILRKTFPARSMDAIYRHAQKLGLKKVEPYRHGKKAKSTPVLPVKRHTPVEDVLRKLIPAGAWRIDHPTACRSVFEMVADV